jgi:hypothetical protein
MYRIIGGDQKEYGPVSGEQIRQWITEGRVAGDTVIRAENATEWTKIGDLPEFASLLQMQTPPSPTPNAPASSAPSAGPSPVAAGNRAEALRLVNPPAIGLIVTAALGILLSLWGIANGIRVVLSPQARDEQLRQMAAANIPPQLLQFLHASSNGWYNILMGFVAVVVGGVILLGAIKMMKLQNHTLAVAASVLAMLPCLSGCCCIGLPIGIWALIILFKPEVKSHFQ